MAWLEACGATSLIVVPLREVPRPRWLATEEIMFVKRIGPKILPTVMIFLAATVVSGENYPSKPVRVVTGVSGSGVDFVARLIAQGLTTSLGQQVIVDNRSLIIAGETVAKAPADGYTLLVLNSVLWVGPLLEKTPYDAVRDFSPISMTTTSPNIIVVYPSFPVTTVKELIDLARSSPGKLNYASGPTGSANHLSAELFKVMAGVNIVRIPYKGSAPAFIDSPGKMSNADDHTKKTAEGCRREMI